MVLPPPPPLQSAAFFDEQSISKVRRDLAKEGLNRSTIVSNPVAEPYVLEPVDEAALIITTICVSTILAGTIFLGNHTEPVKKFLLSLTFSISAAVIIWLFTTAATLAPPVCAVVIFWYLWFRPRNPFWVVFVCILVQRFSVDSLSDLLLFGFALLVFLNSLANF